MFEHLVKKQENPKIETFCKLYNQWQQSIAWFKRQPEGKDLTDVKKRFYALEIKLDQSWRGLTQEQKDDCLKLTQDHDTIRAMEIFHGHWIKYN